MITEQDFVTGDSEAVPHEAAGNKVEGFDVTDGVFYFNSNTRTQMTTEGTWVARETANRRMQLPRDSILPDRFSPGPQACVLATNGDSNYVSLFNTPNDRSVDSNTAAVQNDPVAINHRPLCSCTPVELVTLESIRKCAFIQVVAVLSLYFSISYSNNTNAGCTIT
jgi:hypothetical protein